MEAMMITDAENASRALAKHWMTEMACDHGAQKDQSICACGWVSGWQHNVGEAALAWADHALGQIQLEAREAAAAKCTWPSCDCPWKGFCRVLPKDRTVLEATPASAPVTYSEGKKIYEQGWNDGVEQVRKTLTAFSLAAEKFR